MRARITRSIFSVICRFSPLLREQLGSYRKLNEEEKKQLDFIGSVCRPLELVPETRVIKQGDGTRSLFFTVKGALQVKMNDLSGGEHYLGQLVAGDVFGEISYQLKCARTASVESLSYTTLL